MRYTSLTGNKTDRLKYAFLLSFLLVSCRARPEELPLVDSLTTEKDTAETLPGFNITSADEGKVLTYGSKVYYRYGPSIMRYEDGSMDMWISSPGNSSTQWDWIRYRHSNNGIDWSQEKIVLKPTYGSKDQCSVCDPSVFFYDGYYYLGYTATDYYKGNGTNNMAFVCRSKNPDGPYEKWNGNGWGGNPEPIISYDEDPNGWGVGELSFVIKDQELYIYFTYADMTGTYTEMCKADLNENWPNSIRDRTRVFPRENHDSLDVAYDDKLNLFFGFNMDLMMSERSRLSLYISSDGIAFQETDSTKDFIEEYSHSLGVSKSPEGHIRSDEELLIGYAYGQKWGRWDQKMQYFKINIEE